MTTLPKTVLFTDVEGSTAFTSERGDDVAIALMRVHENAVRECAAQYQGWVVKSTGDGFLVVFPTCMDGVACALDVHARLNDHNAAHPDGVLKVRMGLHAGTLVEQPDDVFGLTVTIASRVASKAASGQLLVSDVVRQEAQGGDWAFVDHGLYWLKGLVEQWRLFEATRGEAVSSPSLESSLPLVGRDVERAAVRRQVERAGGGHGGVVMVIGDAGTGKTRLAEEVGAEAEAGGLRFLVGRCHETSQTDPYTPLIEVLESVERRSSAEEFRAVLDDAAAEMARLLPHIRRRYADIAPPAEAPAHEQRRYLFMSVRDVLARLASIRPLVILFDDLHWADGPTMMLLEHLAAELSDLPIVIIGTYRGDTLASASPLHATLAKLHQQHLVETITLGPLSEADVSQLLSRMVGASPPAALVRTLHGTTDGNPFFLSEVVAQTLEQRRLFDESGWLAGAERLDFEVPESVRFTIEGRLQKLHESTQRLLAAVCPIGRDFGFDFLEALSDLSEDELADAVDEAEHARLIVSVVDGRVVRFSFAHELVRQTLLSQVTHMRRQRLHAGVADALEQVHADSLGQHAAAIAYHLGEAGLFADPDRRMRFLTMAGERALEAAAFEEAVHHLGLVLSLVDPDDAKARAPLLDLIAQAERSLGRLDDAFARWDDALDAYERAGDSASAARVCLDAAIQIAFWRRGRDVTRLVERGLEMLEDGDSSTRAGLLAVAGMSASQAGGYDQGRELLDEALTIATRHRDDWIIGLTLYARCTHHFAYQEFREAVDVGSESIDYLRAASDMWNLANILGYVGTAQGWLGRFFGAAEFGVEGEALAHRLGNWSAYVFAEQARGFGDIGANPANDTLEQRGRHALEMARDLDFRWLASVGHARLGLAAFWRGEWTEALAEYERSAEHEGGAIGGQLGRLLLTRAYLGHRDIALQLLDQARPQFPTVGQPAAARAWGFAATAVEALRLLGEDEEVATLYPTMSALAGSTGSVMRAWDFRLVATLQGIAAGCNGEWDAAEAHYEEALRQSHELPMLREEPEAYRFYAQTLLDRDQPGDRERAAAMLERAEAAYTSFGMPQHAALTRDLAANI